MSVGPKVASLFVYPVKSLGGVSVERMEFDTFGPKFDRRWMVVDSEGKFLTQRQVPAMAAVKVALAEKGIVLSHRGASVDVPVDLPHAQVVTGSVWAHNGPMLDCGDGPSVFLTKALGTPCRLVAMPPEHERLSTGPVPRPVSLVDSRQVLITSTESLDWLNERLKGQGEDSIGMERFRPNVVLSGGEGKFYEDKWSAVRVGGVRLEREKMCGRCVIITTDQESGQRKSAAPLGILAKEHPAEGGKGAAFGTYFNVAGVEGPILLGDRSYPELI